MNLKEIHIAYFIGIGGIGMSALARWFHYNGIAVSGYDKTETPLTRALCEEGIEVTYEDELASLPDTLMNFNPHALVVYTPAIPADHQQYNYLKKEGYAIKKRSEVLGIITANQNTVAVAGTHGKTTTTSMVAHILKQASLNCTAFLGGISVNYHSNMLPGNADEKPHWAVVEADEYDRSFLTLHPDIAIVTSVDPDHLDIYGQANAVDQSFRDFVDQIRDGGHLIIHASVAQRLFEPLLPKVKMVEYAWQGKAVHARDVRIEEGNFIFDYHGLDHEIRRITLKVPGYHNLENAIAAISVGLLIGIDAPQIKNAIESYAGVKRRFEYIIKTPQLIFIDDYAHHPVEIKALLDSVRSLFGEKKITIIFQPHLYSRTRDFADAFAESLSLADEVYLMDIYPAREKPIPGVDERLIFDQIKISDKFRCNAENLLSLLKERPIEVILTVGAGDIDKMIEPIKNNLIADYHVE